MKQLLIIIMLLADFYSFGQQGSFSSVATIDLPANAKKVSLNEIRANLNGKSYGKRHLSKIAKGEFYLINSIVLQLNSGQKKVSSNYLDEVKKSFDEMSKWDGANSSNYLSEIKLLNGLRILTIKNSEKNDGSISFYCVNPAKRVVITGLMSYDSGSSSKKSEANRLLEQIASSLKFK